MISYKQFFWGTVLARFWGLSDGFGTWIESVNGLAQRWPTLHLDALLAHLVQALLQQGPIPSTLPPQMKAGLQQRYV
uniref:Putative secreted peptide n=1 Tax=Anopheles braziliensis TaxID=58242 RepID=A0A2M3ZUY5_9DIPT